MDNSRIYKLKFNEVYPLLLNKAIRKDRTKAELDRIILWLTGYSQARLDALVSQDTLYSDFFANAPQLNPNRDLITGSICGVRLDEIQDPLMREIRYLDKLVDELAKGRPMSKILRNPS